MRVQMTIANAVLAGATLLAAGALAQQAIGPRPSAAANAPAPDELRRQQERTQFELEKSKLESDRLRAEIAKLQAETREMQPWYGAMLGSILGVVLGFIGVAITGWFGLKTALGARLGNFDLRLYEKRLEAYAKMVAATKGFALYFPERVVDQDVCADMGRQLRGEFFTMTGTLLTEAARKRYLTLLHALTHAARAERLNVPDNDDDYARWISDAQVDVYRRMLGLTKGPRGEAPDAEAEMKRCREHRFGDPRDATSAPLLGAWRNGEHTEATGKAVAEWFKDFVVLQFAASRLRTELGRDVSARRALAELARVSMIEKLSRWLEKHRSGEQSGTRRSTRRI